MSSTPAPAPTPVAINIQGNVKGSVINGDRNLVVNNNYGTIVYNAPQPRVKRKRVVPRTPNSPPGFLDRTPETAQIVNALAAGRSVALYGPDGMGKTSLLKQAVSQLPGNKYPNGVALINGPRETGVSQPIDDLAQQLFDTFYDSDPYLKVTENTARPYLNKIKALFLLDHLALPPDELDRLPDLCQSVIWAAPEPPRGQVALTVPVGGLPRPEAIALFTQTAQLTPAPTDQATLNQICELLEDVPLAIVALARWVQQQHASPAEALQFLQTARGEVGGVRRTLAAIFAWLPAQARSLLSLAGSARGLTVNREALLEASGFDPTISRPMLDQLQALALVEAHSPELGMHPVFKDYVRRRLPAEAEQQRRLVDIFLREAQARANDWDYLHAQLGNLLGALDWSALARDTERLGALARLLVPLLVLRGRWGLWQRVFTRVVEVAEQTAQRALQGWALHELGTHALASGDTSNATRLLTEALNIRMTIGDTVGAAYTQHNLNFLLGGPPGRGDRQPPKAPPPERPSSPMGGLLKAGAVIGLMGGLLSVGMVTYCLAVGCGQPLIPTPQVVERTIPAPTEAPALPPADTPTDIAPVTSTPETPELPTETSAPRDTPRTAPTEAPTLPPPSTPTPTRPIPTQAPTPTPKIAHPYPQPQIIANYMPWYSANSWSRGCTSDADSPQAGSYDSDSSSTIARQIKDAQTAGLDGFAAHWASIGDLTDKNFATLLSLSGSAFHSTVTYLGHFFSGTASQATVISQLQYIIKNYSPRASFLRMNGRPVLMFADMPRISIEGGQSTPQQAWAAVRTQVDPAHNTLWIAEGLDKTYMDTFDGIYIYKIDHACCPTAYLNATKWAGWAREYELLTGQPRYFVGTIQPGWDDLNSAKAGCEDVRVSSDPFARDRENGAYYQRTFDAVLAANPDMIIVHSFNEWVEGSYIEPSINYSDAYLTWTSQFAARYRASR